MSGTDPLTRPPVTRRLLALALLCMMGFCIQLLLAGRADAGAYTGGFSPRIIGGKADLNGDLVVNGQDDASAYYGDTDIINGMLDCNNWVADNDGTAGDGTITPADDCHLVGVDGTPDGVRIHVVDGLFQTADGLLPTVFNAADPVNPGVFASDFAWSTIGGRVDSNGDEGIDGDDCHFGIIGPVDILGNPGANECGFNPAPDPADNGLVDLNTDAVIDALDSCSNSCFFGHDIAQGVVQAECPGFAGDPRNDVVGTSGPDTLSGTGGNDIICGLGGGDTLIGKGGKDLLLGGGGADELRGGNGGDVLEGAKGNDHLFGNKGSDHLDGGPGFDHASGGPGHDTFVSCEVRHQ